MTTVDFRHSDVVQSGLSDLFDWSKYHSLSLDLRKWASNFFLLKGSRYKKVTEFSSEVYLEKNATTH